MDNLKTLLNKGEYDLVISLTSKSNDSKSLFARIEAFSRLGNFEEAINIIEANREILEQNPIQLVDTHVGALVQLEEFDKAYKEAEHYKSLPYISQEVEEYINDLPNIIREAEKSTLKKSKNSLEQVKLILDTSDSNEELLNALDKSKNMDRDLFYKSYINICTNKDKNYHPFIRTYSLLILVDMKFDKEIDFIKFDKTIKVNPSKINPPYVGDVYDGVNKKISFAISNPSITNAAKKLLAEYIFDRYPDDALSGNNDLLVATFLTIANEYFSNSEDLNSAYSKLNVTVGEVLTNKVKIEKEIAYTNSIKF